MVIRGIHLSAYVVKVWWLLYAAHRAVFEVRRICSIRRMHLGVSEDVGCLHMSVGLKIGRLWLLR